MPALPNSIAGIGMPSAVAQGRVDDAGHAQRAQQLPAGLAARLARDERLRRRFADGVRQPGVLDEVLAQYGGAHQAQGHAGKRYEQHFEYRC